MLDIDSIEKALLVNVVRNKKWELIIINNITQDYFTFANRELFNYIQDYTKRNEYPDIQLLCYQFNIDDVSLQEYIQIQDLQGLCDNLQAEYVRQHLKYEMTKLNQDANEINTNPTSYIDKLGTTYEHLKLLGHKNKAVGLFDNIEKVLQIDPSDVISTGFKELDDKLIGWKRGEELVVFMARTGQGKSWFGLKFALAAAEQGERVGIYSGEMSVQQLQERILCCAKKDYTTTNEEAMQYLLSRNLHIQVLTQKELRRKATIDDIEEMVVKNNLTMIVVDQLSLMDEKDVKFNTPLRQVYGNITDDLFNLTIKYNLAGILLVQSNRAGSTSETGPDLENIAESDAVAQNATRVISMKNDNGIVTMKILKNRYGNSNGIIRYEVDYGINKYKPIQEQTVAMSNLKKSKARALFANNGGSF